jgi:sugar phosphate isomerase/epimerase
MGATGRREFLTQALSIPAMPVVLRAAPAARKLPIAFSLGCPKWTWKQVLDAASGSGYAAIELRGINGQMDLTKCPELDGSRLAGTLADLKALDLAISDLGASSRMHEPDPAKRQAQLDEGRRFIDLAHRMRVPYVRVFGDKYVPGEAKEATLDRVSAGLRALGEHGRGSGVTVLLESHGDFTDSPTLLRIFSGAQLPTVALLWDTHHTVVAGREAPADTWAKLGPLVRHTHIKDSRPDANGEHVYVLTGSGSVPVREIVGVLVRGGYKGYFCFEWEKAWHPEIDEPEVAIPHFAKIIGGYLTELGVK